MSGVNLRLHASLRKWAPVPAGTCRLSGSGTVKELLRGLGVPEQEAAIIIVNGRRGSSDTVLSDGDTVSVFPLIGGG
ncbi:MAG TPA: MoaD/ThiS family protein [Spirochaetia bacterium]|nr:MoaD/ThiS family protein [Spirochaetia bacterium]